MKFTMKQVLHANKMQAEVIGELRAKLAESQEKVRVMTEALEKSEHELILLHNLDASDDPERLFRNPFTVDTSGTLDAVQVALYGPSRAPAPSAPKPEGEPCPACEAYMPGRLNLLPHNHPAAGGRP